MTLEEATRQYQAELESVRSAFASDYMDDEDRDVVLEDLDKARVAMETAWLERVWGGWLPSEK